MKRPTRIFITIDADNAAFDYAPASEVARILRKLANDFEAGGKPLAGWPLRDGNGNTCGAVTIMPL